MIRQERKRRKDSIQYQKEIRPEIGESDQTGKKQKRKRAYNTRETKKRDQREIRLDQRKITKAQKEIRHKRDRKQQQNFLILKTFLVYIFFDLFHWVI